MVKYPRCDICRAGSPAGHTGQAFIDKREEQDVVLYPEVLAGFVTEAGITE